MTILMRHWKNIKFSTEKSLMLYFSSSLTKNNKKIALYFFLFYWFNVLPISSLHSIEMFSYNWTKIFICSWKQYKIWLWDRQFLSRSFQFFLLMLKWTKRNEKVNFQFTDNVMNRKRSRFSAILEIFFSYLFFTWFNRGKENVLFSIE